MPWDRTCNSWKEKGKGESDTGTSGNGVSTQKPNLWHAARNAITVFPYHKLQQKAAEELKATLLRVSGFLNQLHPSWGKRGWQANCSLPLSVSKAKHSETVTGKPQEKAWQINSMNFSWECTELYLGLEKDQFLWLGSQCQSGVVYYNFATAAFLRAEK